MPLLTVLFFTPYHATTVIPPASWVTTGVIIASIVLILRQLLVIFAAEQGRKQDLVKKRYKNAQTYHISILMPFLRPADYPALLILLSSLQDQNYPLDCVSINLATCAESQAVIVPQGFQSNVRIWQYPKKEKSVSVSQVTTWLIERCLAAGGNSIFVFLKPTDLVKSDFLQNIATQAATSFAIQGYIAFKNPPRTILERVNTLSTRLNNRIGNAGRFHLGLGCQLMSTGWAVKQEVFEMIKYRRGLSTDNLEYTINLTLENFTITWAPNVVVYADAHLDMVDETTRQLATGFDRVKIFFQYALKLFSHAVLKFRLNCFDRLVSLLTPPLFSIQLMLIVIIGLVAFGQLHLPDSLILWQLMLFSTLGLSFIALGVSRCKFFDLMTLLFFVPMTYVGSFLALPVSLPSFFSKLFTKPKASRASYHNIKINRLNENNVDQRHAGRHFNPAYNQRVNSESNLNNTVQTEAKHAYAHKNAINILQNKMHLSAEPSTVYDEEALLGATPIRTSESFQTVFLSNNKNQVECGLMTRIVLDSKEKPLYSLTLEYKSVTFSTQHYRILDQAFYELHAKLMTRNVFLLTCGSCGYFYNPTADIPEKIKNSGVCLYNRMGEEVSLDDDAVTVISKPCKAHCSIEKREQIVNDWKASLADIQ
ncbi:MAG: hypothetical protein AAGI66_01105 [Cyanobacteria bacterium P01_H01_bin.74]